MSLSPLETKFLEIRSFPETKRNAIFSFEFAIRINVTQLLAEQIKHYAESDKGSVINIYGSNKSGRTTTAKTLATLINRERDPKQEKKLLCVTLNFLKAHEEIEQEDIIIIEQGEKIKDYKEKADTYGLEQIINSCSQKNAIAIIVSDQKLIKDNVQADCYLKCEVINEKEQITYCILEINKFCVGYVEVFRLHNEVIERSYELAKEEFLKSEVQRILENIDETTKEVLDRWKKRKEIIFAEDPKDIDPEDPAILFIPVIILGGQGDGKSTLSKILVNVLSEYYSVHNVHSLRHERDLTGMIQEGFSTDPKKFIQVFVANDFTFSKMGLKDLQVFSQIRHYMCDQAGIKQGLAAVIMNQHYLTGKGSDVAYRNIINFLFVLNPSDHDYTRNSVLSKLMPEAHLKFLDYILELREKAELEGKAEEYLRLKGYGICVIKGVSYPFYFNRKDYPIAHIEMFESTIIESTQLSSRQQQRQIYLNPSLDPLKNLENVFVSYHPDTERSIRDWFDHIVRKMKQQDIATSSGRKSHSSVSTNVAYFEKQIQPKVQGSRTGIGLFWETAVFHTVIRLIQEKCPSPKYKIRIDGEKEKIFQDFEDGLPIRDITKPGWENDTFIFEGHPLLTFAWLGGEKRVDFELTIKGQPLPLEAKCGLFSNKHSYSQDKLQPLINHPGEKKFIVSFTPSYQDKIGSERTNSGGFKINQGDKNIMRWVGDMLEKLSEGEP